MTNNRIRGLKQQNIRALGLGMFDGMHLGHAQIQNHCSHLLTFDPHPALSLGKTPNLKRLTTLRELRYWMKTLLILPFDRTLAMLEPLEFLDRFIGGILKPKTLVVGYDFQFGKQKKGNVALIRQWASQHHIDVIEVPAYSLEGKIVKSSFIRKELESDHFDHAVKLMGHPYLMIGEVIAGQGMGRQLGFPTANLKLPQNKLVPQSGVYSGYVLHQFVQWPAMIYIGRKPTFETRHPVAVEVYIHGFEGDLYGQHLKVFIQEKIRGEEKFPNKDALIAQINRDLITAGIMPA